MNGNWKAIMGVVILAVAAVLVTAAAQTLAQQAATLVAANAQAGGALSEDEAFQLGTEAYIYGYPLVTMEMTRRVMTNVAKPEGNARPDGPVRLKRRTYPNAPFRDVTAPNADTLYSPPGSTFPKNPTSSACRTKKDRYYLMPMLSGWTDVFQVPGKRTTGDEGPEVRHHRPGTGRATPSRRRQGTQVADQHGVDPRPDLLHRHAGGLQGGPRLQDQYALVPLSAYGKPYTPPAGKVDPDIDMKTPVREQVNRMEAATTSSCWRR